MPFYQQGAARRLIKTIILKVKISASTTHFLFIYIIVMFLIKDKRKGLSSDLS